VKQRCRTSGPHPCLPPNGEGDIPTSDSRGAASGCCAFPRWGGVWMGACTLHCSMIRGRWAAILVNLKQRRMFCRSCALAANQRTSVTPIRGKDTDPTKFHSPGGFAPMTVSASTAHATASPANQPRRAWGAGARWQIAALQFCRECAGRLAPPAAAPSLRGPVTALVIASLFAS